MVLQWYCPIGAAALPLHAAPRWKVAAAASPNPLPCPAPPAPPCSLMSPLVLHSPQYLIDYVTLDLHQAIKDAGFKAPLQASGLQCAAIAAAWLLLRLWRWTDPLHLQLLMLKGGCRITWSCAPPLCRWRTPPGTALWWRSSLEGGDRAPEQVGDLAASPIDMWGPLCVGLWEG